jgi:hypothetical protein
MRLTLDSTGHRVPRMKPTCLLHTWRPHRQWPFTLVLHLHQYQSSHNLHLQYLAKNQSTQRCQSLITPGSDHPPVLEPHMVLNLPLDECIDNTHIVTWEKRKRKETNQKETPTSDRKTNKGKEQDHLKKTSLGPLRQGQQLDTFETKPCSNKERKTPNQSSKTTKISPCTHASFPWTNATPPGRMHANHLKKTEQLHQLSSDRLDRSPPPIRPVLNVWTDQHPDRLDRWPRPVRPVCNRA